MNNFDILGKYISEINGLVEICMKKVGFSYNEFALFYTLYFSHSGECTQKQVNKEWFLPKQTIFNICKEYRQKGWIELSESQTDKRKRIVRLTQLGRIKVGPAMQIFTQTNERIFSDFGEKKSTKLFALLDGFSKTYKKQLDEMKMP